MLDSALFRPVKEEPGEKPDTKPKTAPAAKAKTTVRKTTTAKSR